MGKHLEDFFERARAGITQSTVCDVSFLIFRHQPDTLTLPDALYEGIRARTPSLELLRESGPYS